MQNMINNQEIIIMELEHSKSRAIEELEELKIKVGFKTDKLNEWKQKYETLQEECEMFRLQVNCINNLNHHNKRGNSLFTEVDDKRQTLTAELEMKREKYETLKKCLSKANHENNLMKMEMMRLEKQLLETERNDNLEKSTLIQSYKNHISDLEAKIR